MLISKWQFVGSQEAKKGVTKRVSHGNIKTSYFLVIVWNMCNWMKKMLKTQKTSWKNEGLKLGCRVQSVAKSMVLVVL